jgi:hypothetical protein
MAVGTGQSADKWAGILLKAFAHLSFPQQETLSKSRGEMMQHFSLRSILSAEKTHDVGMDLHELTPGDLQQKVDSYWLNWKFAQNSTPRTHFHFLSLMNEMNIF